MNTLPLADSLSIFPLAQQIIGIGGVIKNTAALTYNAVKLKSFEHSLGLNNLRGESRPQVHDDDKKKINTFKENMADRKPKILTNCLRIIPIVGTFSSFYYLDKNRSRITGRTSGKSDYLCLLPVVQQLVGAFCALGELAKLIDNACSTIFAHITCARKKREIDEGAENPNQSKKTQKGWADDVKTQKLEELAQDRSEHGAKLFRNVIRMTPMIGTLLSIHRILSEKSRRSALYGNS